MLFQIEFIYPSALFGIRSKNSDKMQLFFHAQKKWNRKPIQITAENYWDYDDEKAQKMKLKGESTRFVIQFYSA